MARCCGGSQCACLIQASGTHLKVLGTGTAQDPFVISADVALQGTSNDTFLGQISGSGTVEDPWILTVEFASTARLTDFPDVQAAAPSNGQVLGFDGSLNVWTPRAPTTAASGSVLTDPSLTGDGSSGSHLAVNPDPDGFLETNATGLRVSDEGQNNLVNHFGTEVGRDASPLTPILNSITMLDDFPGVQWYWTGSTWAVVSNGVQRSFGDALLEMSGPYDGGLVNQIVDQVVVVTNADGTFDALDSTTLSGAAGVLACIFQPTGTVPFAAMMNGDVDSIQGTAYRLDDGTPYASQAISGSIIAYVY